jgi:hypothetical protein
MGGRSLGVGDRIPFDPYDFFGYLATGLVVLVGLDLSLGFPPILNRDFKPVEAALVVVGAYVAGQLIATPAKALLEDFFVGKILARPSVNLFRRKRPLIRGTMFPGFYKALPPTIGDRILAKARSEGIEESGETLFLHVRYRPEILNDAKLMAKLDSFINKYGFARNLAFTAVTFGIALSARARCDGQGGLQKYAAESLVTGVFLVYRYLKFFRQYSYEMFNTYGGQK